MGICVKEGRSGEDPGEILRSRGMQCLGVSGERRSKGGIQEGDHGIVRTWRGCREGSVEDEGSPEGATRGSKSEKKENVTVTVLQNVSTQHAWNALPGDFIPGMGSTLVILEKKICMAPKAVYDPVGIMAGMPVAVQIVGKKWAGEKVRAMMKVIDEVLETLMRDIGVHWLDMCYDLVDGLLLVNLAGES